MAHLLVGMMIFAGVVGTLAWTLELRTGAPQDMPATMPTTPFDQDPSPATDTTLTGTEDPIAQAYVTVSAYIRSMTPRLMWLLYLVAISAMALAGTTKAGPNWNIELATFGGGILGIDASGPSNTSWSAISTVEGLERTTGRLQPT